MINAPQPIIHVFKEITNNGFKQVSHYQLQKVSQGTTLLSNLINLSVDRGFAKSKPYLWLRIWQGSKWSGCITGLFKTPFTNVYMGGVNKRKHLLLFRISDDTKIVTCYYFYNFYTKDLSKVLSLINV